MSEFKPVQFLGNSLASLRKFPQAARKRAGQDLLRLQLGREPADWKPISTMGSGVREIRLRDEQGVFRIIYVAKFADAIFVLHCFQKKTQKTAGSDLEIASRRYKELVRELTS
jgi:phage-related protein